jgi:hypothetical protein
MIKKRLKVSIKLNHHRLKRFPILEADALGRSSRHQMALKILSED